MASRSIRPFRGLLAIVLAGTAGAQVTVRVSLGSDGNEGNNRSGNSVITPDGRFVAFQSDATNLVPGDTNGFVDLFVRDRATGTTDRINVGSSGIQANAKSYLDSITPDGRYVTFSSAATNLVPGDTNARPDIFVRDRVSRTTERVSLSSGGAQADAESGNSRCSADGRFIAFGRFWLSSNLIRIQ